MAKTAPTLTPELDGRRRWLDEHDPATVEDPFEYARRALEYVSALDVPPAQLRDRRLALVAAAIERFRPADQPPPRDLLTPAQPQPRPAPPTVVDIDIDRVCQAIADGAWTIRNTPMSWAEFQKWLGRSERPTRRLGARLAELGILYIQHGAGGPHDPTMIRPTEDAATVAAQYRAKHPLPAPASTTRERRTRPESYGWTANAVARTGMSRALWYKLVQQIDRMNRLRGGPWNAGLARPAAVDYDTVDDYWDEVAVITARLNNQNDYAAELDRARRTYLDPAYAVVLPLETDNVVLAKRIGHPGGRLAIARERGAWRKRTAA